MASDTIRVKMWLPRSAFLLVVLIASGLGVARASDVEVRRLRAGALQPDVAVDSGGVVHVVFLKGDAAAADVYYTHWDEGRKAFAAPVRVNSQPGSAVAAGSIRGAQIAIGGENRAHIVWNGSSVAEPKGPRNPEAPADSPYSGTPLLYSYSTGDGTFSPQRNLLTKTWGLDGGGSIAADEAGNVYVAWHGKIDGAADGEEGRDVWLARSTDNGESFAPEEVFFDRRLGACACCGMRILARPGKSVTALFRSARETVHRDIYLLRSQYGRRAAGLLLDPWEVGACPMTSMALIDKGAHLAGAWETEGQVYWATMSPTSLRTAAPIAPGGEAQNRKHPRLAQTDGGEALLVWTSVPGWAKPGAVGYQAFSADGQALGEPLALGEAPVWSFAAVYVDPGSERFIVVY